MTPVDTRPPSYESVENASLPFINITSSAFLPFLPPHELPPRVSFFGDDEPTRLPSYHFNPLMRYHPYLRFVSPATYSDSGKENLETMVGLFSRVLLVLIAFRNSLKWTLN